MKNYIHTDQLLHQLSQLIAKVNKAYLPHLSDDSHTNLAFDEIGRRITGRWFTWETKSYLLVFDFQNWAYQLMDDKLNILIQIPQKDSTVLQTQKALINELQDMGIFAEQLSRPLHFKIPEYKFSKQRIKQPSTKDLIQWEKIRAQANHFCRQFLDYLQKEAEVRIWPHHFDTGIYVEVNSSMGLGFGLAMADSLVETPYYYFSGYSLRKGDLEWKKVKKLKVGKWIVEEGFLGAIWPVDEDFSANAQLWGFIEKPLQWYLNP